MAERERARQAASLKQNATVVETFPQRENGKSRDEIARASRLGKTRIDLF